MNILFLTVAFPESSEDRNIYTDLMEEIKEKGHDVYIVTSRERKYKKPTELINQKGLKVLRIKTGNLQKVSNVEKGISTLLIERQFIRGIKRHLRDIKFDLIIYSTPPVTFEKVIKYVKKRDHSQSYLLLKDIFPQNAVDIGILKKNSLIYKYFRKKEIELYKVSNFIGCMSQANVDYIIQNNDFIDAKKLEICPNSIKPIKILESEKLREQIRFKYGIPEDKTVFVYGGNLGKPQGIDFLIEVLKKNRERKDACFLIAGSGTEYFKIEDCISKFNITNVKLYSYLPKEDYDKLIQASDVGMLFLDHRFTIPNFPSRMLTHMEFSMPIIAATDINTDVGKVIEEGKFGLWSQSGDIKAFNEHLDVLCSNREELRKMGKNARVYLEDNYTASKSCEIILNHFK